MQNQCENSGERKEKTGMSPRSCPLCNLDGVHRAMPCPLGPIYDAAIPFADGVERRATEGCPLLRVRISRVSVILTLPSPSCRWWLVRFMSSHLNTRGALLIWLIRCAEGPLLLVFMLWRLLCAVKTTASGATLQRLVLELRSFRTAAFRCAYCCPCFHGFERCLFLQRQLRTCGLIEQPLRRRQRTELSHLQQRLACGVGANLEDRGRKQVNW
jgi:hypothetical protein